jgi:hypothetical protein
MLDWDFGSFLAKLVPINWLGSREGFETMRPATIFLAETATL